MANVQRVSTEVSRLLDLANEYKSNRDAPGAFETYRLNLARELKFFGFNDFATKVAGGQIGDIQAAQNQLLGMLMNNIKGYLPPGSRLGQNEFNVMQKAGLTVDTDPAAFRNLFNFWNKVYYQDAFQSRSERVYEAGGGNPLHWMDYWRDYADQVGFTPQSYTSYKPEGGVGTAGAGAAAAPAKGSWDYQVTR
jgi:hypothetical protein